jgi:uncharacterized membrane protein
MRFQRRTISHLVILAVGLWCIGFTLGPVVETLLSGGNLSQRLYASICHQDPVRSFSWFGDQWAVCHRCSAIYLSFGIATLFLVLRDRLTLETLPKPSSIMLLLLPVVIDALTDLAGIRSADVVSRLMTGSLTGIVLASIVVPVLFDALKKLHILDTSGSPGGSHA